MNTEIKKMWAEFRLKREEARKEEEIIHKWSMLALKIGTFVLLIIGLIKLSY